MEIHKRGEEPEQEGRDYVFIIRQVLNIVFMIGAVVGAFLYWYLPDETTGILVVMTAMFFKMAECVFRFRRR